MFAQEPGYSHSPDATEDDDHRYMMFSATFNKDCRKLAREYLSQNYVRISIGRPGSSHLNVEQQVKDPSLSGPS